MTTIGIVIEATSNLKVLGSLIDRIPLHHQTAMILIPRWRKGKPYDSITSESICRTFAHITPDQVVRYDTGGLTDAVGRLGLNTLILLNPYRNFVQAIPVLASLGVRVYGLDYFVNSLYVAASYDEPQPIQRALQTITRRIIASSFWEELEHAVQPAHRIAADRFVKLGTPLGDPLLNLEPVRARHFLGISGEQPIVSVFTPNIRNHQAYFFYGPATWFALRHLARALRTYCDQRGYRLVVKSRQKQWDAHPFIAVADDFIDDRPELVHPSASALLLRASKLAVHFGSMMVLEAALAGVPTIGFSVSAVDKLHAYMRPDARTLLRQQILEAAPGIFRFKNVSQALSVYATRTTVERTADSMLDSLGYAQKEYEDYNTTFSGWQPENTAADRIWSHILGATTIAGRH